MMETTIQSQTVVHTPGPLSTGRENYYTEKAKSIVSYMQHLYQEEKICTKNIKMREETRL